MLAVLPLGRRANRRVSIWRYTKIGEQWKYVKPTYGRNNKIKPEDGTYYVRWREGKRTMWHRCYSPVHAEQECRRREALLTAQAYGIVAPQRTLCPTFRVSHLRRCR